MSDNGQSPPPYYYYRCNIRVETASASPALRKKRRHRNNVKFYHIPYRIAYEEVIVPPITSIGYTSRNKVLIYHSCETTNLWNVHIEIACIKSFKIPGRNTIESSFNPTTQKFCRVLYNECIVEFVNEIYKRSWKSSFKFRFIILTNDSRNSLTQNAYGSVDRHARLDCTKSYLLGGAQCS